MNLSEQKSTPCLAIVFRGWMNIGEISDEFRKEIESYLPKNSRVIVPKLPMGMFSLADPGELCQQLDCQIEKWVKTHYPEKVILIGFSTGTLLARGAVLEAVDNNRHWLKLLDRMVLIAGILRGWTVSSATPVKFRVGGVFIRAAAKLWSLCHFLKPGGGMIWKRALGELTERGEPFVIGQRLRFEAAMKDFPHILIVCLMGTQDEFVSPADVIELGYRDNVFFIQITGANHLTILHPSAMKANNKLNKERKEKLIVTLCGDKTQLESHRLSSDHIDGYLDPLDLPHSLERNRDTKDVVIILHGIRDEGFWTKRVATCIKGNQDTPIIRAPTPSYGYFSALDFVFTPSRYKKTRWFLEQYADLKALFPEAEFSFVGHSNGTYLAAHAMEVCSEIRFKNIYFAGSVVRRDYRWNEILDTGQVSGKVVNVFASDDAVVATAPGFIESLRIKRLNVGGAGYEGFYLEGQNEDEKVINVGPFSGGHGAGIAPQFWEKIEEFMNTGVFETPRPPDGPNHKIRHLCYRLIVLGVVCLAVLYSLGAIAYFLSGLFDDAVTKDQLLYMVGVFIGWWSLLRLARVF